MLPRYVRGKYIDKDVLEMEWRDCGRAVPFMIVPDGKAIDLEGR